jgi:hypothetical protein
VAAPSVKPARRHRRRAHAALAHDAVERLQMDLLALFHLAQQSRGVRLRRQAIEHGALAAINLHRAELAGVIDADHFLAPPRQPMLAGMDRRAPRRRRLFACRLIAHGCSSGSGRRRAATKKVAPASASETRKL